MADFKKQAEAILKDLNEPQKQPQPAINSSGSGMRIVLSGIANRNNNAMTIRC